MKAIQVSRWTISFLGIALALLAGGCISFERRLANANAGNPKEQYAVGKTYRTGDKGISRDLEKSVNWLTRSASAGYSPAMLELGDIYLTEPSYLNPKEGVDWYLKAKQAGNTKANRTMTLALLRSERIEFFQVLKPAFEETVESGNVFRDHELASVLSTHFLGYMQKLYTAKRSSDVVDCYNLARDFMIRMKGGTVTQTFGDVKSIERQLEEWKTLHPQIK